MANKAVTYVPRPMPTLGGDTQYLQQELAAISGSIKSSNAAIEADESAIAANTADISTNTGHIATHTSDIAANTTAIGANTASIAAHEAAWTAYTPTVTGGSAVVNVARYKKIGKTTFLHLDLSYPTGGGTSNISLPAGITAANSVDYLVGREIAINGYMYVGHTTGTVVIPIRYDNSQTMTAGMRVVLSGSFEAA